MTDEELAETILALPFERVMHLLDLLGLSSRREKLLGLLRASGAEVMSKEHKGYVVALVVPGLGDGCDGKTGEEIFRWAIDCLDELRPVLVNAANILDRDPAPSN